MSGFGCLAHQSSGMVLDATVVAPIRLVPGILVLYRFPSQRATHTLLVAVVAIIINIRDAHYHGFA